MIFGKDYECSMKKVQFVESYIDWVSYLSGYNFNSW